MTSPGPIRAPTRGPAPSAAPCPQPAHSELADSALLLALISPLLLGLSALLAIPVAVGALVEIRRSGGAMRGRARAVAALAVAVVVLMAAAAAIAHLLDLGLPGSCEQCLP